MEALKEAHGLETDRMAAELAHTHEVRCRCSQRASPHPAACTRLAQTSGGLVIWVRNFPPTSSAG